MWRSIFLALFFLQAQNLWACEPWNIAIVPPVVADSALSRAIANQVIALLMKSDQTCKNFLNFDRTQVFFDYLAMTAFQRIAPSRLKAHHIALITERMQADHVMYIEASPQLDFAVVSIFGLLDPPAVKLKQELRLPLDKALLEGVRSKGYWNYLSYLTPNSVTLGYASTRLMMSAKDPNYKEIYTRSRGELPPLVSSIGFRKISHRNAYSEWFDYGWSIFPNTYFFAINQESLFQNKSNLEDTKSIYMNTMGSCTNINIEGTLATKMGSTYAALGWGPCLLQIRSDEASAHLRLDVAGRINVGHRVFITDPLFFYVDFDILEFGQRLYSTGFARSSTIIRSSLGLGWYMTDAEGKFMGFWRRLGVR